ncbi:MAG: c-type cytochrome, partial [Psychrobacter sp.]
SNQRLPNMSIISKYQIGGLIAAILSLSACKQTPPPDHRAPVTLPLYTAGDADNGAIIYQEACGQCHRLNAGLNKKGPQLMNVYGAPAATLKDYTYSEGLKQSGWVWNAETLDPYIADAEKAMTGSKMLSNPMPDAKERADVIAYLSTLRAPLPAVDDDKK